MLATLLVPLFASPADWFVDVQAPNCAAGDGSASAPFCEIADALAVAVDGDTIFVAAGAYRGNLLVASDVHLVGSDGARISVHQPDETAIRVPQGVHASIDSIDVDGASAWTATAAGLHVEGDLVLRNATISNVSGGAPLYGPSETNLIEGSIRVYDSVFQTHYGGRLGGALAITGQGYARIERSLFEGNTAGSTASSVSGFGGAIGLRGSSAPGPSLVLRDSTLTGNAAGSPCCFGGTGGAIYLLGEITTPLVLENTTISGNTSSGPGAIDLTTLGSSGQAALVRGCTITANGQDYGVPAVRVRHSQGTSQGHEMIVTGSLISGNLELFGYSDDLDGNVVSPGAMSSGRPRAASCSTRPTISSRTSRCCRWSDGAARPRRTGFPWGARRSTVGPRAAR